MTSKKFVSFSPSPSSIGAAGAGCVVVVLLDSATWYAGTGKDADEVGTPVYDNNDQVTYIKGDVARRASPFVGGRG